MGLTSLVQLRATVGALAALALAGSAFATGRVTAACPSSTPIPAASREGPEAGSALPVTFAHTHAGAAAAAASFATTLFGPLVTDRRAYLDAVGRMALPSARSQLEVRAAAAVTDVVARFHLDSTSGRRIVIRSVPLSWRIESDDGTTVRVRIWAMGLIAVDGSLEPTVAWSTGDYVVVWTTDGWRLVDDAPVTGLVPRSPQTPTVAATLDPELATFAEYADAPAH